MVHHMGSSSMLIIHSTALFDDDENKIPNDRSLSNRVRFPLSVPLSVFLETGGHRSRPIQSRTTIIPECDAVIIVVINSRVAVRGKKMCFFQRTSQLLVHMLPTINHTAYTINR